MSIGTISSPATWLLGTVAPPAWFQNVQDNINGYVVGTNSIKGLVLDGTGGASVTPVSGALKITSGVNAISTTTPSTSITKNTLYGDLVPFAGGVVSSGGAIICGWNLTSVGAPTSNVFTITFITAAASANKLVFVGTVDSTSGGSVVVHSIGTADINVKTRDAAGSGADRAFHFVIYATPA